MYQKVKHRLVTLYTITTGVILVTALISLYLSNVFQINKNYKEQYKAIISYVSDLLGQSNIVDAKKLVGLEEENQAIIYIEENGIDIGYRGSYMPGKSKDSLVEELCSRLDGDNFNLSTPTIRKDVQSKIYTIQGVTKNSFWSSATKIQRGDSNLMFMVMLSLEPMYTSYRNLAGRYVVILLVVMCFVYMMSRVLMQKVLIPLKENAKKQDDFIACASHELRSPLAYIKTANSTLSSNCLPYIDNEHKEYLESFIENTSLECDRMSLLLEEMLELASAETKAWTIHRENTDLDKFFSEVYERLLTYCTSKSHYFEIILPEEPFGIAVFDEQRLYQVIQTLVNNALQYTPEKTKITLTVEYEKKNLIIRVIDHGEGILDCDKSKVFERYYRQD